MNLVCFPNNTAGGLVCDLLNNKRSPMIGYRVDSREHDMLKINDTPNIQLSIDENAWHKRIQQCQDINKWVGTHAHPTVIPNISEFDNVIAITTMTRNSKLYRWLRYYHGWFLSHTPEWEENNTLESIDKIRKLCKNIFLEFTPHPLCNNIEFEDIVNGNFVRDYHADILHFQTWQKANPWLYNLNNSWAEQRFNEAEWESLNKKPYKYI